jgi:hypothetical protein
MEVHFYLLSIRALSRRFNMKSMFGKSSKILPWPCIRRITVISGSQKIGLRIFPDIWNVNIVTHFLLSFLYPEAVISRVTRSEPWRRISIRCQNVPFLTNTAFNFQDCVLDKSARPRMIKLGSTGRIKPLGYVLLKLINLYILMSMWSFNEYKVDYNLFARNFEKFGEFFFSRCCC